MSLQLINIGSAANDKSGDTLRTAGQKINSNFTELYSGVQVPPATLGTLGTVRPDGTTVTINNGIITAVTGVSAATTTNLGVVSIPAVATSGIVNTSGSIVLATASTTQLGGVKVDGSTIQISNGIISASNSYTLPKATTSTLGGIKVDGTSIGIDNTTGIISIISAYTLPTASTLTLGGVKVDGSSITINNGVISVSTGLSGTVVFKGAWNANTNTPTLASGTGTTGWQYIVSTGGTRNLGGGSVTYASGDLIIYDGTNWIDVAANNGVVSFNARTGAITLTGGDVTTALGYTPIQSSSLSVATTTASAGGALSYAAGTFTFAPASIPTYTVNTQTTPTAGGSLSLSGSTFTYTPATVYSLPTATDSTLGGIKIDNNTIVINSGVISVGGALTSATIFKGAWNATTNTPTLTTNMVTARAGWQYIVSVAGSQNVSGTTKTYNIGDLVIYDGQNWIQIPGSNNVQSFNTRQGAITLTSGDVTTALGFTPIQSSSLSVTTGAANAGGSLSYAAGVLTFIPAAGVTAITVASANGFTGTVTSTLTPAITIQTSITGILKGNGTAISAAVAGTDYQSAQSVTGIVKSSGTTRSAAAASDINSTFGSQTQNFVYAAPGGASGNPTFRSLVAADIPSTIGSTTISSGSLTFSGAISAPAWTTSGIRHVAIPTTLTDTTSTGTVANAYTNSFGGNTIAATNAGVTFTNYATVFLNDPAAGTNVTITNAYSLITAGNVKLGSTGTGTIAAVAATATTASTAASVGYLGMPQQSKSSAYTTVIGDAGKHIYVTATATITIDSNANLAYPIGTTIAFIAASGATVTIAITSDTMYLGGTGTTGSRTLAAYGMATAVKVTATSWFINGTGLT